jgi:hypothetical protein
MLCLLCCTTKGVGRRKMLHLPALDCGNLRFIRANLLPSSFQGRFARSSVPAIASEFGWMFHHHVFLLRFFLFLHSDINCGTTTQVIYHEVGVYVFFFEIVYVETE